MEISHLMSIKYINRNYLTVTVTDTVLPSTLALTLAVPACTAYTLPVPDTATAAPSDHHMSALDEEPATDSWASEPAESDS